MTVTAENKSYLGELEVVNIRLVKEPSILSEIPITSSDIAVDVITKFMSDFDREVICVLNLTSDGKPISMNIAGVGTLDAALVSPRDVMKSSILSNAVAFIMFHCHPSGNPHPSREDAVTTQRMKEAGQVMQIQMLDHIIVGCGNSRTYSFREHGLIQCVDTIAMYDSLRKDEKER